MPSIQVRASQLTPYASLALSMAPEGHFVLSLNERQGSVGRIELITSVCSTERVL